MKEINAMSLFNDLRKAKVGDELRLRDYEINQYEIVYDYCNDYSDEHNIREIFEGTWSELQDYIKEMKSNGCYSIEATYIGE